MFYIYSLVAENANLFNRTILIPSDVKQYLFKKCVNTNLALDAAAYPLKPFRISVSMSLLYIMTISLQQSCSALASYDTPVRSCTTSPPGGTVQQDRRAVVYADKQVRYHLIGLKDLKMLLRWLLHKVLNFIVFQQNSKFLLAKKPVIHENTCLSYRLQNSTFGGLIFDNGRFSRASNQFSGPPNLQPSGYSSITP